MSNSILHFAELHIGSSIIYKCTLIGNYFLKSDKKVRILISFNRFSYIQFVESVRDRSCDVL